MKEEKERGMETGKGYPALLEGLASEVLTRNTVKAAAWET